MVLLNFLKWFTIGSATTPTLKMSEVPSTHQENVSTDDVAAGAARVDADGVETTNVAATADDANIAPAVSDAPTPEEAPIKKRKRRTKAEVEESKRVKAAEKHAKQLQRERKQLEKATSKPPEDVPSAEGEMDSDSEPEDDVRGFMSTLRDYMRAEIAQTMKEYKTDPIATAAAAEQAESESAAAVELPPRIEPRKVTANHRMRNRPTIIFV